MSNSLYCDFLIIKRVGIVAFPKEHFRCFLYYNTKEKNVLNKSIWFSLKTYPKSISLDSAIRLFLNCAEHGKHLMASNFACDFKYVIFPFPAPPPPPVP